MSRVSVILPVYNAEPYVSKAIESILSQTMCDLELVIVNDGSTDKSAAIISRYAAADKRILFLNRSVNRKLVYSLNEAIEASAADIIARMDADDISEPYRLEKQLRLMETENCDVVGCHYHTIMPSDKFLHSIIAPISEHLIRLKLCCSVPFAHGSVLVRKELAWYEESAAEDYQLWAKLSAEGNSFANVNEFLYRLRVHSGSFGRRKIIAVKRCQNEVQRFYLNKNLKQIKKSLIECYGQGQGVYSHSEIDILLKSSFLFAIRTGVWKYFSDFKRFATKKNIYDLLKFIKRYYTFNGNLSGILNSQAD